MPVLGGSRSGKSAHAESLPAERCDAPVDAWARTRAHVVAVSYEVWFAVAGLPQRLR